MPEDEGAKRPADIPDLKKAAQERFAWTPGAVMSPAAASPVGRASPAAAAASALIAKVRSTVLGRIAALAVLVGVGFGLGVGVLGVAFLEVGEAKPSGRKGLAGLTSRLRVRPGARDRLRWVVSKGEVFFAPFRGAKSPGGAEDVAVSGEAAEAFELPEVPDVDINVDLGGPAGTRAGALSTGLSGSSGARGDAAGGKGLASRDGAAPKFNESAGKLNAKSVKKGRVTRAALATSGDRRTSTTNKGDFKRTITPVVSGAGAAGSGTLGGGSKSGLDFLLGGAGAPVEASAPSTAAGAPAADGGGGGGSSSGGDGAGPGTETPATDPQTTLDKITSLMEKANKETDKAHDEMTKAKILAAGGHLPQAHYHYNRAEKAKKKSKEYSDQAQALTDTIGAQYQQPPASKAQ